MEPSVLKQKPLKLMYVVTEDWYFYTHRLPFARAAREAGYEVAVVTRYGSAAKAIEAQGIRVIPFAISRSGMNPFYELATMLRLALLLRRERPALVHFIALKPVFVGNPAARLARVPHRVSTIAGLGTLFIDSRLGVLAKIIRWLLSRMLRGSVVLVQNQTDRAFWMQAGLDEEQIVLVPGVGVDLKRFSPRPEPPGTPVVLLPARMLWTKGIKEFITAAEILKSAGVEARFVLVGPVDEDSPVSVPQTQLEQWQAMGLSEWWGYRSDMASVYQQAHLIVLPSYREGLPKVLLEAAATARAIVTTDVPGCRDVVKQGVNGLLVPPRDPVALARAIRTLIEDPERRRRMGQRGRELVEQHFAQEKIIRHILSIYNQVVS